VSLIFTIPSCLLFALHLGGAEIMTPYMQGLELGLLLAGSVTFIKDVCSGR
jgi:hypothetical protein